MYRMVYFTGGSLSAPHYSHTSVPDMHTFDKALKRGSALFACVYEDGFTSRLACTGEHTELEPFLQAVIRLAQEYSLPEAEEQADKALRAARKRYETLSFSVGNQRDADVEYAFSVLNPPMMEIIFPDAVPDAEISGEVRGVVNKGNKSARSSDRSLYTGRG